MAAFNSNGILVQIALDNFVSRAITGTAGNIVVSNGDGVSGNPVINLVNVGTAGTYGSASQVPVITTDAQGRVTSVVNTPIAISGTSVSNTPAGNISATTMQGAINELDSEKQSISEKGQANGYAPLGPDAKIAVSFLPDTVVGSVDYKGTWNANTNTPNLVTATPDKGDYYVVNVAGSTLLGGITDWKVGDWAIYNGTAWEKVDNTDQVSSVFGRQGTVVAQAGDYNAGQITNTPAGGISAVTVQAAINELDTEKADKTITISAGAGLTGGGDLSANRTISMPNVGTAGTYGSASQVPVITTDAQGRVSGVVNTAIAITSSAVTDFANAVRGTALTGYTVGTNTALAATDTILGAFGKVQAQLNGKANLVGNNSFTGGTQTLTPTLATDNALVVTQGRFLIGSSTAQDITGSSVIPPFQILGTSATQMVVAQYSNDINPSAVNLLKSRGALNSQGLVADGDDIGRLQFRASDGVNFQAAASIRAIVDGTAAANSMPGRLVFLTTPLASITPLERMRISQAGEVTIGGILGSALTNNLLSVNGNVNSYFQSNVQNLSTGISASGDVVVTADNGTDTTNFIDMGINNSGYADPTFTINGPNDGYLYVNGGDLSIGTATANKIVFFTGDTLAANERMRISPTGNVGIGTTNPVYPLQVQGNTLFGTAALVNIAPAPLNLVNGAAGALRTQLNLVNTGGGGGAGSAIDFHTYDDQPTSTAPGARISAVDDNFSAFIAFSTKIPGAAAMPLPNVCA